MIESVQTEWITTEEIYVQLVYYNLSAAAAAATTLSLSPSESELEGNDNNENRKNDNHDRKIRAQRRRDARSISLHTRLVKYYVLVLSLDST